MPRLGPRSWSCLLVALAARAEAPTDLALPLDCEPGEDCWILRYVDHDSGPGRAATTPAGRLTGDGHKGTDFAIRDLEAMAEGVEVRAAAAGVVDALRDGVPDISVEEGGRAAIAGKECGNGIRIAHGDGWTTWYCHLRRGSLMVAEGDRVEVGQPLASRRPLRRDQLSPCPFRRPPGRAGGRSVRRPAARRGLRPGPGAAVARRRHGAARLPAGRPDQRRHRHRRTRDGGRRARLAPADQPAGRPRPALVLWVEGYWVAAGRPRPPHALPAPTARRWSTAPSNSTGAGGTGSSSRAPGARATPGPRAPTPASHPRARRHTARHPPAHRRAAVAFSAARAGRRGSGRAGSRACRGRAASGPARSLAGGAPASP